MAGRSRPSMSPLEDTVMRVIWAKEMCTADEVRQVLLRRQPMKDSTVRTILRRLEAKGYVSHEISGRTYVYRPRLPARRAATQAVRQIVDRLCEGSVEQLLQGMVSDRIVTAEQLEELARRIAQAEAEEKRKQDGEGNAT